MFVLCAQEVVLAQRMCPHASGVMLLGAQVFFTHFIPLCVQYRTILVPRWCRVLLIWWYIWCKFCVSVHIVCTRGIAGSKNVPACVRGDAVRRPGIFYTILGPQWSKVLLIWWYVWCKFWVSVHIVFTVLAQRMCPHASGVMLLGARGFFTRFWCTMVSFFVSLVIRLV